MINIVNLDSTWILKKHSKVLFFTYLEVPDEMMKYFSKKIKEFDGAP